uniref:Uncharacterized protein n=1 Tax=Tetranychus urticae TaxID=32264 RepID=T1KDX9_TETUR
MSLLFALVRLHQCFNDYSTTPNK